MEISMFSNFYRNEGKSPLLDILSDIRNGRYAGIVNKLREALRQGDTEKAEKLKKSLPAFTLSATYNGRRIESNISHYNGMVILDIDNLQEEQVETLKAGAAAIPYTLFCFGSPGAKGLKIGVIPAVNHPLTVANHRNTFLQVQQYYEKQLGVPIDPSGKDIGRLCFVSYDPLIYINPKLKLGIDKLKVDKGQLTMKNIKKELSTNNCQLSTVTCQLKSQLHKARKQTTRKMKYQEGNRNNYLYLFANNCNRLGVPSHEKTDYCRRHFTDMGEEEVRSIVNSAYTHSAEYNTAEMKQEEKGERCSRMISNMKKWLNKHFKFRYNIVTTRVEYRSKGNKEPFRPMNDVKENTLWSDLQEEGISCKQSDLHALLTSEFSKAYDPFVSYFNDLPAWDGTTDYIARLADTVQTTNQLLWHECFRKWLVAAVACAIDEEVVNHTVLVLSSEQGLGKTKWCTNLVPPELSGYRHSGIPNIRTKDAAFTLTECFLINLDEMEGFSARELSQLKEMVTKGFLHERRFYGKNAENHIRRASLTGSINNSQILTDLTGTRRFLCFEAKAIDYLTPVDYKNVYAQALALYKNGFRYWFNAADIARINQNNEYFRVRTPEEELFYTYFRKPAEEEPEGNILYLSASEIMQVLCLKTFIQVTKQGTNTLSMVLKKGGFTQERNQNKRVFAVVRYTDEEVEAGRKKIKSSDNEPSDESAA